MGGDEAIEDGDDHEYLLTVPESVWQEFSGNVPKNKTYSEVITDLIRDYNAQQEET